MFDFISFCVFFAGALLGAPVFFVAIHNLITFLRHSYVRRVSILGHGDSLLNLFFD